MPAGGVHGYVGLASAPLGRARPGGEQFQLGTELRGDVMSSDCQVTPPVGVAHRESGG